MGTSEENLAVKKLIVPDAGTGNTSLFKEFRREVQIHQVRHPLNPSRPGSTLLLVLPRDPISSLAPSS